MTQLEISFFQVFLRLFIVIKAKNYLIKFLKLQTCALLTLLLTQGLEMKDTCVSFTVRITKQDLRSFMES